MSNLAQVVSVNNVQVSVIAYKGVPVVTTAMLASFYQTESKNLTDNFSNNKDRFVEGKHFFKLVGEELKAFLCTDNFGSQISSKVRNLILWTERGAARHAKMLDTDQAWEIFEALEDSYFGKSQPARNECLTHEQINQIRLAVKERMVHTGEKNSTVYSELFRSLGVGHTHTIYQSQFARAMDQVNNYPRSIPETNEGFFLSEFRASEFDARLRSLFDLAGLLGNRGSDIATVFQRQCHELNTLLARESMIRGGMSVEQAMRRIEAQELDNKLPRVCHGWVSSI